MGLIVSLGIGLMLVLEWIWFYYRDKKANKKLDIELFELEEKAQREAKEMGLPELSWDEY